MKKTIVIFGLVVFSLCAGTISHVFDFNNADASRSQEIIANEETAVKMRLDQIKGKIITPYGFDLSLAQDIQQEYSSLFQGLPNTETLKVLQYHLYNGVAKNDHEVFQKAILDLILALADFESITDEKEQKAQEKEISSIRDALKKSIQQIEKKMDDIPRMGAEITVSPKSGNVPLTVAFNGLLSEDPTNSTIPSANYSWSFIDYDGSEKDLGVGPNKVVTFEQPGNYVLRLEVSTASGEKILPGVTTQNVVAGPPELTADFFVEDQEVGSVLKIPLHDAQKGIRFDPGKSIIPEGVKATEYLWTFNGEKRSTGSHSEVISHIFTKEGQASVSLKVTDNTGASSEKKMKITIESSIAVIDVSTKNPLVQEIVTFNGQRSSLNGNKAEGYHWKIYDPNGNLIADIEDRPQFSYQFEDVGTHDVNLDIGNGITAVKQIEVQSKPPVAQFSVNKDNAANPAEVVFDASSSFDPEGGALRYSWDFEGDGTLDIRNSQDPRVTHVYQEEMLYQPRLVVTDEYGYSDDIEREVRIDSLFSVDFSADSFAVHKGKEMVFRVQTNQGTLFHWEFSDGAETDSKSLLEKHVFSNEGKQTVRLTAFNEKGESATVVKNIFVGAADGPIPLVSVLKNGEPAKSVPNLCGQGKDGFNLYRYELMEFSGGYSVNSNGNAKTGLEYRWNFGGEEEQGETATKKFIQISAPESCSQVTLSVTDTANGKTTSSNPVYVFVRNAPPEITSLSAIPDEVPCTAPCQVSVSLSASDPDGTIQEYRWWAMTPGEPEKIDLHLSSSPNSSLTLPVLGPQGKENTFSLYAEAIDNDGGKTLAEDSLSSLPEITVINGENPGHSVNFFTDHSSLPVGEEFVFTAEVQNPSGDDIPDSAFLWDFDGDGAIDDSTSGPTAVHSYSEPGEYDVRLEVEHHGISDSKTRTVYVTEKKEYPIADFLFAAKGLLVSFDAGPSEWNQSVPGNTLLYFWDFDVSKDSDGDGVFDNDVDAEGESVDHIYPRQGEYGAQLLVQNSSGKTGTVTKTVSAKNVAANISKSDTIKRSIHLSGNAPMNTLDLVARIPDSLDDPVEVIAYGFGADGSFLTGDVFFEPTGGLHVASEENTALDQGRAGAFLTGKRGADSHYSVRVTVHTQFGSMTENISF